MALIKRSGVERIVFASRSQTTEVLFGGVNMAIGIFDRMHGGLGLGNEAASAIFVHAQEQERNGRGGGPEFGLARDF